MFIHTQAVISTTMPHGVGGEILVWRFLVATLLEMTKTCLLIITLIITLFFSSSSEAFRRLPYNIANPNALCTTCERVSGNPPSMTITANNTPSDLLSGADESADLWNTVGNSNFKFKVTSDDNVATADDGINSIRIGDYTPNGGRDWLCQDGVLGMSIPQPPSNTVHAPGVDPEGDNYTEISERDLVLCASWNWYVGAEEDIGGDQMDLVTVLSHELGHHFGLGHSNTNNNPDSCDGIGDTSAVMDTCVLSNGAIRRAPLNNNAAAVIDQGDVQGIQHIYDVFDPGLLDDDADGVPNRNDNCVSNANPDQRDLDGDHIGDVCDSDADGDGLTKTEESGIGTSDLNPDTDGDGLNDFEEHNVYDTNPLDPDCDDDGLNDSAEIEHGTDPYDADTDDDGLNDFTETEIGTDPLTKDNPAVPIIIQFVLDDDSDGDGVADETDNCPHDSNPNQYDIDGDGKGNECDDDIDGDGLRNQTDNCPVARNPTQADRDSDGLGDACDPVILTAAKRAAMAGVLSRYQFHPIWLTNEAQTCSRFFNPITNWPARCQNSTRR